MFYINIIKINIKGQEKSIDSKMLNSRQEVNALITKYKAKNKISNELQKNKIYYILS